MLKIFADRRAFNLVERDAIRMIQEAGEHAFTLAGEMAWREDAGLLKTQKPGHWGRVQQEVGKLMGVPNSPGKIRMASAETPTARAPLAVA